MNTDINKATLPPDVKLSVEFEKLSEHDKQVVMQLVEQIIKPK